MTTDKPSVTVSRRQFLRATAVATAGAAVLPSGVLRAQDKRVVLAFVGAAHIHTPSFVDLLRQRADVTVPYVWDHDVERARKSADKLGAQVVPLETIWSDPAVQGVVICAETHRHRDLVLAATRARKHQFVEKPLGITARESWAMAAAIEKAGLLFTTGYFMRAQPEHIFLKQEIAQGHFGTLTRLNGFNCHSGSLGGWFDTEWRWMADLKQAGVGGFGDLGTHSLDIMMWLAGEVASATADINVVTGRYGDCDESGQGLLRFQNGASGTLDAGWLDLANPVSLQVSGTDGFAYILHGKLHYTSRKVEGSRLDQPWTRLPAAPRAPLHQFCDAMGGQTGLPLVTPREAAGRVSVMEAMYQGWRKQRWIKPS
jgi:predicted dehydrogenase